MEDVQVRIDHAEWRLGEWVCGWLERLSRYLGIVGLLVSISRFPISTVIV
jgi:hypothetical protein